MKKWFTKIVLIFTLISLVCFYSGEAMAMGHDMNMNNQDNCIHCYAKKALSCDAGQAIMPLKLGKNRFDQSNCSSFTFRGAALQLRTENKKLFDRPPEKTRLIPDHFTQSKVVLLI